MKALVACVVAAMLLFGLSGCIVYDDGGGWHHHHYDRDWGHHGYYH